MIRTLFSEIFRKLIHISSLAIPLIYFFLIKDKNVMASILTILTLISLLIEYARLNRKGYVRFFFYKYLKSVLRSNELKGHLTGATWMLIGFTSSVIIFDFEVSVLALLFLSVGDAVAAVVGRALPIGKIWDKSILGSLSGFLFCVIFGLAINNTLSLQIIIFGAISGMFIELIPLKINDNFSIPIFSGFIMQILKEIL
jgi:glycerol-3-phosphate acyltransferase PlsY